MTFDCYTRWRKSHFTCDNERVACRFRRFLRHSVYCYVVRKCNQQFNFKQTLFLEFKGKVSQEKSFHGLSNLFLKMCKQISLPNHPVGTVTFQSRVGRIFFTVCVQSSCHFQSKECFSWPNSVNRTSWSCRCPQFWSGTYRMLVNFFRIYYFLKFWPLK